MKYKRGASSTSVSSESYCSSDTDYTSRSYNQTYSKIKSGLRRSNPAAIVLWAFHSLPSKNGLTSRRVIGFLKKHYKAVDDPKRTGKSIGTIMRCAVDFGLLQKRGNRYYLAKLSSKKR
ncbi:hypothetical protein SFRURICE_000775 [Spodoptera frugiperda]|uniref:SFRICE_008304 n=1 Tax=Spodoptera frugiperda TaxID=7108 RepID=A0A2H1W3H6_SPOFR|nr:hypothetical protein SFRURICE_000775 [Spodoptera frugiperda]